MRFSDRRRREADVFQSIVSVPSGMRSLDSAGLDKLHHDDSGAGAVEKEGFESCGSSAVWRATPVPCNIIKGK